jgi:hypothetical protein
MSDKIFIQQESSVACPNVFDDDEFPDLIEISISDNQLNTMSSKSYSLDLPIGLISAIPMGRTLTSFELNMFHKGNPEI